MLRTLNQIKQQHRSAAEQQHGESVFGPVHLVRFIDAGKAIQQPLDRSNHGIEKSALTTERSCHEHAKRLGERQNYSQKYEDLYPAIGCHFRISPVSATRIAGRPSTLHLRSA